jgi:putative oxidoreductase
MKTVFGDFVTGRGAWGLLVVRLVLGLGLTIHGWSKIQSPGGALGWMGPDAPIPGFLQGLATLAEFGGGLALIAGLLTPLASLGIAITMLVAIYTVGVKGGNPFINDAGPSYETAAAYLAVALLMIFTGPGALSLDYALWGKKSRAKSEPLQSSDLQHAHGSS